MSAQADLAGEVLERELSLKHGPAYMDASKAIVGKRFLRIQADYKSAAIVFKKRNNNGESLEIAAEWQETKYERCSLGHQHEIKGERRMFHVVHLAWEYVEQLVEWIQLGSWTEVSRLEHPWKSVARDTIEFLNLVEKTNANLKPSSAALRRKIEKLVQE